MTAQPLPEETQDWRDGVALVLRNWRSELVAALSEFRLAGDGGDLPVLVVRHREVEFLRGGGSQALGPFEFGAEGARQLESSIGDTDAMASADIIIRFEEDLILRPRATLPRASRQSLQGAFRFELARMSAVAPENLYFDHEIVAPAPRSRRVQVVARALRRRSVDDAVTFAHDAGLSVAGFRLGDDAKPADWRSFPVDRSAWLRSLWARWGSVLLGAAVALLVLASLFAMASRDLARADALQEQIARQQPDAVAVERLEREMAATRARSAYLASRKAGPSVVAVLAALTDALPDGTWLTDIQLDEGRLHIQGFSHDAPDLLARLDRSGPFANAQFGAPLVRNEADGTERFDLVADVKGQR
jgi:general secretion pathway protein L